MPDLDGAFMTPEQQWAQDEADAAAEHFAEIDPHGRFAADFEGTPLAVEAHAFAAGIPFRVMRVADYLRHGLRTPIPEMGYRLHLQRVRNYEIEVRCWRGGPLLGHVPHRHVDRLADALAGGWVARAYVVDPGDGTPWSASIVIVGEAAAALWPNPPATPPRFPVRPVPARRPGAGLDDDPPF